jgi:hypothetical protein
MSSSIYTNTGIVESSWNSRGLILHNGVTKSLITLDNGTLWAAVRENNPGKYINIYRSTNNGFSWEKMWSDVFSATTRRTGISGLNVNGPVIHLSYNEELKKLILWHSFYETTLDRYDIEPFIFNVTDTGLVKPLSTGTGADPSTTEAIATDMDDLYFDISYSDNGIFLTYSAYSSITCQFLRHTYQASADGGIKQTIIDDFFPLLSTCSNDNDQLDIFAIRDFDTTYRLVHLKYDHLTGQFGDIHTITDIPTTDVIDLNIERDGWGNLLAYWSQRTPSDTAVYEYYSISYNDGVSWDEPIQIPTTDKQGDFRDNATQQLSARTVALGGITGFIIGYVRTYDEIGTGYVRLLTSENGINYNLGDENIAISPTDEPVSGFRFFRPIGTSLMNLNNPGEIRIGYNLGISSTQIQVDRYPNYFGQKLLNDEAFLISNLVEFKEDVATENDLLFSFNLLGSTADNVDYHAEGLVGPLTRKYESAFLRFGTSIYLERYDPIEESYLSDKSSYSLENSWYAKVFFEDINYSNPSQNINESYETFIERDTRRLHLPPDFHLSRNFLINKGNKLKRTVWIAKFDGNDYELTQVVPKFIDNQIAYYTANAYVVGPSRNPFTRTILPSET